MLRNRLQPVLQATAAWVGQATPTLRDGACGAIRLPLAEICQLQLRSYSSEAVVDVADPDVQQAAQELGVGHIPLDTVKGVMEAARLNPRRPGDRALLAEMVEQPAKKRLTWGDLRATSELGGELWQVEQLPTEPVYDMAEWVAAAYPRYGYGASSSLYTWQEAVAQRLGPEAAAAYYAAAALMASEPHRAALLKQASHELARLWDWQHRRVALGLTPNTNKAGSTGSNTAAAGSSSAGAATAAAHPEEAGAGLGAAGEEEETGAAMPRLTPAASRAILYRLQQAEQGRRAGRLSRRLRANEPGTWSSSPLEDDLFLETAPGSLLDGTPPQQPQGAGSSSASRGLQAMSLEGLLAEARRAAATASSSSPATWSQLSVLDDSQLRSQQAAAAAASSAARRAAARSPPWSFTPDSYVFDLGVRPPTPTLDLLTDYLSTRYADIMLQRSAVDTAAARAAAAAAAAEGEGLEGAPLALTTRRLLSVEERATVTSRLGALLEGGAGDGYAGYSAALAELYSVGLITWRELAACSSAAAAKAAEEQAAAAAQQAPAAGSDLQALHALLTGPGASADPTPSSTQPGPSASAGASASTWQEAQAAWQAAQQAVAQQLAPAAATTTSGGDTTRAAPELSLEEAAAAWDRMMAAAGGGVSSRARWSAPPPPAPRLVDLLAASSAASSAQQLKRVMERLAANSSSSSSSSNTAAPQSSSSSASSNTAADESSSSSSATPDESSSSSSSDEEDGTGSSVVDVSHPAANPAPQLPDLLAALSAAAAGEVAPTLELVAGQDAASSSSMLDTTWHQVAMQAQAGSRPGRTQQGAAEGMPPGADAAALQQLLWREAGVTPLVPTPYPGAARLLRWRQRWVLHSSSASTAHPEEARVMLEVNAAELAAETGLGPAGLQHLLRVAGRRYKPDTGDLVLVCDRYASREENRRWCSDVLGRLVAEGRSWEGRRKSAQ